MMSRYWQFEIPRGVSKPSCPMRPIFGQAADPHPHQASDFATVLQHASHLVAADSIASHAHAPSRGGVIASFSFGMDIA
jgi:hypothetical protein